MGPWKTLVSHLYTRNTTYPTCLTGYYETTCTCSWAACMSGHGLVGSEAEKEHEWPWECKERRGHAQKGKSGGRGKHGRQIYLGRQAATEEEKVEGEEQR